MRDLHATVGNEREGRAKCEALESAETAMKARLRLFGHRKIKLWHTKDLHVEIFEPGDGIAEREDFT